MAHGKRRVGNTLEALIRLNRETISAYTDAVTRVKSYSQEKTLQSIRAQHFEFIRQLKEQLKRKDYDSDDSNLSFLRQLHDGWADVTAQFTKGDPTYIFSDIHRMLETIRNLYKDAQEAPFDSDTKDLIANQLSKIEDNIETIKKQYQKV